MSLSDNIKFIQAAKEHGCDENEKEIEKDYERG